MELRKIASKKPLKLLTLLLTAMLIASASAAVYYSLSMTSTVTTATPDVRFVLGADNASAGVTITDGTVATLANLSAYPGIVCTYEDPLKVKNNGASPRNIKLVHKSVNGNSSLFDSINFTLVDGTTNDTLVYTGDGAWGEPTETTLLSIGASAEWSIKVETKAASGASTGQAATIVIEVYVEE